MKPKQFDTNIIFRTLTTTRDKFKEWCKNNNTTISKEFNNYMIDKLNTNTSNTTNTVYKHYVGKGHTLYGMWVSDEQYNKFNELYNGNINGCNDNELKALCSQIQREQPNNNN